MEPLLEGLEKTSYREGDTRVKVFGHGYLKSDILNEALNQARVEETGLRIPKLLEVRKADGKWAIVTEFVEGETLQSMMEQHPDKMHNYMEQFVLLQKEIQSKRSPLLTKLKDKMNRKISQSGLDATTRYDLHTRLNAMHDHIKVCHGDFHPSNVIVDKDGRLPRIKEALLADAVATTAGAVLGTSTTTTFVESSSGVAAGARTGLSSVVTGFLFLISVVLSPIFCSIPSFATAPALIFVGFLMVSTVTSIEFTDMTEAIPAYLCLLAMPLMYSISEGIAIGVISYVIINVVCGKAKKITPLMYVLAVLFVCKYIFL